MTELVLYTRADAAAAVSIRPADVNAVLGLTPNARAAAAGYGVPHIDPMTRYTDAVQAHDVARVVRARRRMLRALDPQSAVERELLIDQFNRVAYSALRLWRTLGDVGPWLVPGRGGFTLARARDDAHRRLLSHILAPKIAGETKAAEIRPPPLPGLYRALRRLALARHPATRVRLVVGMAKEQFGLFEAFARRGIAARTTFVGLPQHGAWEYVKLVREILRNVHPNGQVQVSLTCTPDGTGRAVAARAVDAVADNVISPAFELYVPLMARKLDQLASARIDARRIFSQARPHAYTGAEISTLGNWMVAEAAGVARVPRLVMSRNAHAPADRPLARDSAVGYLRARYPRGLVDDPLFWSPAGARAAEAARGPHEWPRVRPFLAPKYPLSLPSNQTRTVLFADTYAAWWFPHSWSFLNGDEVLRAISALASAIDTLPDVRLVVRAKHKPECDLDALMHHVHPSPACDVKMRDAPFEDDLARADLLVSFHSTVVEEAIAARRPVLLWGSTNRHRFLPARATPPTGPSDRAVVYAVGASAALPRMVGAILEAHARRPLTDHEVASYVWPQGTPDIDDLATEIVRRVGHHCELKGKESPLATR